MSEIQKQLNQIRDNIKSGKQRQQADAIRPLADPSKPDCLPELKQYPDGTEELSVPIKNLTARAVYKRPPGGFWVDAIDPEPLTYFAKDTWSEAMEAKQKSFSLIRQDCPDADPDAIVKCIQAAFTQLNNNPQAVISPQAIYNLCVKQR